MAELLPPPVGDPACYEVVADASARPVAWLEARRQLVTASEVPIVLGLYGSCLALWNEKLGLLERADFSDNEAVAMGHDLEEPNARIFAKRAGRHVAPSQQLLRSRAYPWLGATLDYVQWQPDGVSCAPLECKSTGRKDLWPDDGEPSMRYQAQLQTQIVVTGSVWGSLSAILGSPYLHHRWRDYNAHPGFATMMIERTQQFHESLSTGIPPEADDKPETSYALRHAALNLLAGDTILLPPLATEWHDKLGIAKAAEAEAKRERRYYENLLSAAIGRSARGELPNGDGAYTFNVVQRDAYTVQPTSYRQLRYTGL